MVNIGIMKVNTLLVDALYESDELFSYAETDAAADAQWHPLDQIAKDCVTGKLKQRSARSLFKKALENCDYLYESQNLSLDDMVEGNQNYQDSLEILRETAWECGSEGDWVIFSDDFAALSVGTSMNPFNIVEMFSSKGSNVVILRGGFLYFVRSDNIVDGWEAGQSGIFDGKPYPLFQVTLLPEPEVIIGEKGPAYGPPIEVMRILADSVHRSIGKTRKSFQQVIKEAERGW